MNVLFFFIVLGLPRLIFALDCSDCALKEIISNTPKVELPIASDDLIQIEKIQYKTNPDASFCKRPVEMLDTIVVHHTAGLPTTTPSEINELHTNRSSNNQPWYMIGYSYVISAPYKNTKTPEAKITEGRPIDLVGSHAGSDSFEKMDEVQKKLWEENKIICGKEGEDFSRDDKMVKDGKMKTNATTLGVVVIGNYAPIGPFNPSGYAPKKPRYPTQQTLDMIARLSCQLQKKHPRIKNIKWHSYYKPTSCPGTIKAAISKIIKLTKDYGCEFN